MNAISHYIARKYLAKASAKHVRDNPQVVCFSFDLITHFIHLDGQYERDELKFLADKVFPTLDQGGTCLDVGANIGNHSLHFAGHFKNVISFEPHPRTFRLLSMNAELADNIEPLNVGASTSAETVEIAEDQLNIAASSIGRAVAADSKRISFDLVRIDDVPQVAACERIPFMKFDVEGHEALALEGARETIARHKPLVVLEVLRDEITDGSAASIDVLRTMGYRHFYEPVAGGILGKLPRKLLKAARALTAILTGKRPSKAERLAPIERLEDRSYLMVICSIDPMGEV